MLWEYPGEGATSSVCGWGEGEGGSQRRHLIWAWKASGSSAGRGAQALRAEAALCVAMLGAPQAEPELAHRAEMGRVGLRDEAGQVGQITAGFSRGKCAL